MSVKDGMMVNMSSSVPVSFVRFVIREENHERCTAVLIDPSIVLSVFLPHVGFDEEDYFADHIGRMEADGSEGLPHWRRPQR